MSAGVEMAWQNYVDVPVYSSVDGPDQQTSPREYRGYYCVGSDSRLCTCGFWDGQLRCSKALEIERFFKKWSFLDE